MAETVMNRVSRDEIPEDMQPAWDALNEATGEPAFVEVFANAPELLRFAMGDFYQKIFYEGRVSQRYKQLGRLRLSIAHGCRTCNLQNIPGNLQAGFTQAQIDAAAGEDRSLFDDAERAVLDLADQIALTNPAGHLDQDLYDRLRTHFSDAEICELGLCFAVISGLAKLSFVMDLVEREETCPFVPEPAAKAAAG